MPEPLIESAVPALALSPEATLLARHLAVSGATSAPYLAPYQGTLTPQHLDAPEAETGAWINGAAIHDLGWLRRITVRGEDRLRWLSGMVTNTVETLEDRTGAYNLVLNAQGRIQGDGYVWRSGEGVELETTVTQAEALLTHFDHFIIMDDVELAAIEDQSALGLTGLKTIEILKQLGLPELAPLSSTETEIAGIPILLRRSHGVLVPHYGIWTASSQIPALWQALVTTGAAPIGAAAVETLRIVEGVPAYGTDIQSRDLAQETAQDRAISFTKGCYLGQEIVERVRSRGQVHRHLRALEITAAGGAEAPATGTELFLESTAAGSKPMATLTSVATVQLTGHTRIFAIGMVRAEAEIGNRQLTYPGGSAQILHASPILS